jgi:hypothetical protein
MKKQKVYPLFSGLLVEQWTEFLVTFYFTYRPIRRYSRDQYPSGVHTCASRNIEVTGKFSVSKTGLKLSVFF